ncbi:MAG: TetR/AcrR family transcriptional regulator [Myxococcota bacterium]
MPRAFTDRERERIRGALLDAGRAALPRSGMRRTSVDQLTRAAGVSKGAFYLFFDDKEALWVELLREGEATARALVRDALAAPPELRLRRVVDAVFTAVWADPILRILTDAEELAWLTTRLPPGALAAARADDDLFFAEVHHALASAGLLAPDVDVNGFCAVPSAALALAQHAIDDPVRGWVIDGLVARLGPA